MFSSSSSISWRLSAIVWTRVPRGVLLAIVLLSRSYFRPPIRLLPFNNMSVREYTEPPDISDSVLGPPVRLHSCTNVCMHERPLNGPRPSSSSFRPFIRPSSSSVRPSVRPTSHIVGYATNNRAWLFVTTSGPVHLRLNGCAVPVAMLRWKSSSP